MRKYLLLPLLSLLCFNLCSADSVSRSFENLQIVRKSTIYSSDNFIFSVPVGFYTSNSSAESSCNFSNISFSASQGNNNITSSLDLSAVLQYIDYEGGISYEDPDYVGGVPSSLSVSAEGVGVLACSFVVTSDSSIRATSSNPITFTISTDFTFISSETLSSSNMLNVSYSAGGGASDCSEYESEIETLSGSLAECNSANASCAGNYISCQSDLDSFENYNSSLNRQLQACLLGESISETGSISLLTLYQLEWTEGNDVFHLPINSDLTLPSGIGAVSNNGAISIQKIDNDYTMDSDSVQELNNLFVYFFVSLSSIVVLVLFAYYIKKFMYMPFISKE